MQPKWIVALKSIVTIYERVILLAVMFRLTYKLTAEQRVNTARLISRSITFTNQKMSPNDSLATSFQKLHVPGKPLVLTNVYDALTAEVVANLQLTKALATTSGGIARAIGVKSDDLTLEENLMAVRGIAKAARAKHIPLTVDYEHGYNDKLENGVTALIEMGVVGLNLEDFDKETQKMYTVDEAVDHVKRVLKVAIATGIPNFAVNARCDSLVHGGSIPEVIERGKAYLAAGALCVFVIGRMSKDDMKLLAQAFDGKLNVVLMKGGPTVLELAEINVARISMGPFMQAVVVSAYSDEAERILKSG
jgi:2-methylisocitrate lyase-like PEP mutase family enzyme